jgi:hypothetical protein
VDYSINVKVFELYSSISKVFKLFINDTAQFGLLRHVFNFILDENNIICT